MTNKILKALTVSIVIPAYNEEGYLEACLKAVAAQTVKPLEVIVVDNNSTDKTVAIAKRFSFVRLVKEKRQGVTYARDRGFDLATGDIIGRIDADTVLPPDWVATAMQLMTDRPHLAAVSGPTGFYDLPHPGMSLWLTKLIRTSLFYGGKKDSRYLFGSNMLIRQSAWRAVAKLVCHESGLHEDNDLAIHLDKAGLEVGYSNRLTTNISVRRTDVPPRDTLPYAFSEYRTYRHHGILSFRAIIAGLVLLAIYPGLKLAHRAYDDKTGHYSWAKFQQRPPARPHPQP